MASRNKKVTKFLSTHYKMKVFVIRDIHGRFGALKEVLRKSKFDYKNDLLIILGDVVDGGSKVKECVDEILKIKNYVLLAGNHDKWFVDNWMEKGKVIDIWYYQGGRATIKSYVSPEKIPESHKRFFKSAKPFYIRDNMLFVHGGFNPNAPIQKQHLDTLIWNRQIIKFAHKRYIPLYKHVFIGHTTTQNFDTMKPLTLHNLTVVDTGAGWDGKLTIMDVDTKEYWQSRKQKPVR